MSVVLLRCPCYLFAVETLSIGVHESQRTSGEAIMIWCQHDSLRCKIYDSPANGYQRDWIQSLDDISLTHLQMKTSVNGYQWDWIQSLEDISFKRLLWSRWLALCHCHAAQSHLQIQMVHWSPKRLLLIQKRKSGKSVAVDCPHCMYGQLTGTD